MIFIKIVISVLISFIILQHERLFENHYVQTCGFWDDVLWAYNTDTGAAKKCAPMRC